MHYYSRDSPQFLWLAAQEESLGQVLIQPSQSAVSRYPEDQASSVPLMR